MVDDVRHAHLAVEHGRGAVPEVVLRRPRRVRAVPAHATGRRMRDVVNFRMEFGQRLPDASVDRRRRIALVAPAVQAHGGVVPDAQHRILHVAQEEIPVVRVRAVGRVREPEVLPDDDAVPVAGLVELVIGGLADPVADHGEIQVAVIADGDVVLAPAVTQI